MSSIDPTFEVLLLRGASWLLAVAATWGAVLVLAGTVEAATSGRWRGLTWVGCPAPWRPALLLVAGSLLALPATAASASTGWLPVPDRPVDGPTTQPTAPPTARPSAQPTPRPTAQPSPPRASHAAGVVVVAPGDSLWGLARGLLAPSASQAEVLALTERLAARNRAVIGADPDLIHPGQRLQLPPTPPGDRP